MRVSAQSAAARREFEGRERATLVLAAGAQGPESVRLSLQLLTTGYFKKKKSILQMRKLRTRAVKVTCSVLQGIGNSISGNT